MEEEYIVYSLGQCPDCSSYRIGIIEHSLGLDVLSQNKRALHYYKKYHCYYKTDSSRDWEEGFSANRFCMECKSEWYEKENGKKRFTKLIFTDKKEQEEFLTQKCYLDENEFQNIHRQESYRLEKKEKWYKRLFAFIKKTYFW